MKICKENTVISVWFILILFSFPYSIFGMSLNYMSDEIIENSKKPKFSEKYFLSIKYTGVRGVIHNDDCKRLIGKLNAYVLRKNSCYEQRIKPIKRIGSENSYGESFDGFSRFNSFGGNGIPFRNIAKQTSSNYNEDPKNIKDRYGRNIGSIYELNRNDLIEGIEIFFNGSFQGCHKSGPIKTDFNCNFKYYGGKTIKLSLDNLDKKITGKINLNANDGAIHNLVFYFEIILKKKPYEFECNPQIVKLKPITDLCPNTLEKHLIKGNRYFDSKVKTQISINYHSSNSKEIIAEILLKMKSTKNSAEIKAIWKRTIYRAPNGKYINPSTFSNNYLDTSVKTLNEGGFELGSCNDGTVHKMQFKERDFVHFAEVIGDTGADDVSNDLNCRCDSKIKTIYFKPIRICLETEQQYKKRQKKESKITIQ